MSNKFLDNEYIIMKTCWIAGYGKNSNIPQSLINMELHTDEQIIWFALKYNIRQPCLAAIKEYKPELYDKIEKLLVLK